MQLGFLVEAKKACYAGSGPRIPPFRPGTQDLKYEKDGMLYYDTYAGGEAFIGEEGLWVGGRPVWLMNYAGRMLEKGYDYGFLMEALRHAVPEMPYRGPAEYRRDKLVYRCRVGGDPSWFQGAETIHDGDNKIYECLFHGGEVM